MPSLRDIGTMKLLATARREGAERARVLAAATGEKLSQEALIRYAQELELQAEELDAQVAALRDALAKPSANA